jgi:hypothetical protein
VLPLVTGLLWFAWGLRRFNQAPRLTPLPMGY